MPPDTCRLRRPSRRNGCWRPAPLMSLAHDFHTRFRSLAGPKAELVVDVVRRNENRIVNPHLFQRNLFDARLAGALTFQADRQVDFAMLEVKQERAAQVFGPRIDRYVFELG